MKGRILFLAMLVVFTLPFARLAHAITIGFAPSSQIVGVGDTAAVELTVSGLGHYAPDSLSTFDVDVTFDPAILGLDSVVFGDPVLGDQLDLWGLGSIVDVIPGAGTVNLYEFSLDSATDLDTLQAGSFTLATLNFEALALGTSALEVSVNALGDPSGGSLSADVTDGSVTVAVPEPTAFLAFLAGSVLVGYAVRRSPARC